MITRFRILKITLFFALSLLFKVTQAQNTDLIKEYDENIFYPQQVYLLNDGSFLINDLSTDNPIYKLSADGSKIEAELSISEGPGGLSGMYKQVSISGNHVFIWDFGRQRLQKYDQNLNFIQTIENPLNIFVYSFLPISSEEFLLVDDSSEFLKVGSPINQESFKTVSAISKEVPIFEEFNNSSLLQDLHIVSSEEENSFVFGHEFSSRITKIKDGRISFTTLKPFNLELNETDVSNALPDLTEYPLVILDMKLSEGKLFVLHKGTKVNKNELTNTKIDINLFIDKHIHSDRILIYNYENGEFITEIALEMPVRAFDVKNNQLVGISTFNTESKLYVFSFDY